ncbi:hypothetical protein H4R18_003087 [Coemansia javaensis]|uniref:Peptidase S1 domain-containing protein n=1 Tax=Coemansia javaensis TaxID=2761396 RepID=A0A9W8HEW7_9FUNG|nr:hypothetical protein H4R18_003087 [Coemansia javaensis]
MRAFWGLLAAAHLAAAGASPRETLGSEDFRPATDYQGALLAKGGAQTTCDVALLGASAGFVAANCLDYAQSTALDASTTYEVLFYDGTAAAVARYPLQLADIHVHPSYNPSTLVDNIAVVQFNQNATKQYTSYVDSTAAAGLTQVYVRRTVAADGGAWNTLATTEQGTDSALCKDYSAQYQASGQWVACTGAVQLSTYSSACQVPYGVMYVRAGSNLLLSALYSYSVVFGNDTCANNIGWLSYYTFLAKYAGFAANVLGRPIDTQPKAPASSGIETMGSIPLVAYPRATTVGGDFYKIQHAPVDDKGPSTPADDDTSSDSTSASISNESGGDGDSADAPQHHGMTTAQKIIVGTVVPIGAIGLAIAAFIAYSAWRSRRQDESWDPYAENSHLQNVALRLNLRDTVVPPPYTPGRAIDDTPLPK